MGGVLPLCREAVSVFHSFRRLGNKHSKFSLLFTCSWDWTCNPKMISLRSSFNWMPLPFHLLFLSILVYTALLLVFFEHTSYILVPSYFLNREHYHYYWNDVIPSMKTNAVIITIAISCIRSFDKTFCRYPTTTICSKISPPPRFFFYATATMPWS